MRLAMSFCVVLTLASLAHADDWPQWLGPKRDGGTAESVKPWTGPLKQVWKQPVGEGHGGPVVAKGTAYLFARTPGKDEEALAAFDAGTGKPLWSTSYPRRATTIAFGNGPRAAPCVADGKVYTFGITSILTCFDAADGKIVWQVDAEKTYKAPQLTFGSSCSPLVVGDVVLVNVGAKGASIVAFDKNTGKEVWKALDDPASYSSGLYYEQAGAPRAAFLTSRGLVSVTPNDGKVQWTYKFVDLLLESSCTPMIIDGKLLVSSITAGSVLVEEEAKEPKVKKVWSNTLNCYFSTPVALGKDSLYLVTGSLLSKTAVLRCVDAATGKELWSRDKVGKYHATLVRTGDNKLLMVEEKGDLVLIDPNRKAYTELARASICGNTWAHPAIANGRLYIRDAKNFICVDLAK